MKDDIENKKVILKLDPNDLKKLIMFIMFPPEEPGVYNMELDDILSMLVENAVTNMESEK